MNKKRYLKKWVIISLILINILLMGILSAECENIILFITSKLCCLGMFSLNNIILYKHSHLFED